MRCRDWLVSNINKYLQLHSESEKTFASILNYSKSLGEIVSAAVDKIHPGLLDQANTLYLFIIFPDRTKDIDYFTICDCFA